MTDLIKRDDALAAIDTFKRDFEQSWKVQFSADIAALPAINLADRIEELEKQCSVYARSDQFLVEDINELEAKLAKAVETLRFYAPKTFGGITFVGGDDAGQRAAASLAELRVTA